MEIKLHKKLIQHIKRFKYSTTEIADALNKTGSIPLCYPISQNTNFYKVGTVRLLFAANNSNWGVHNSIDTILKGDIVVIFTENCSGKAIIGDLISKYILELKKAEAIVVHGLVRDSDSLIESNYPIWSMGKTPIGCNNNESIAFDNESRYFLEDKYSDGIAVCDTTGVVVIQNKYINDKIFQSLKFIRDQEIVWLYCLTKLGWNTQKIVNEKAYLNENIIAPRKIQLAINRLKKHVGN